MSPDSVQSSVRVCQVTPIELANLNPLLASPGPEWDLAAVTATYVRRPKTNTVTHRSPAPKGGRLGRLEYEAGFMVVRLDGEKFDLRQRPRARACLEYLVSQMAVSEASARHLEREIDPEVRRLCRLPPPTSYSNLRIHHYFNDRKGKLSQLATTLIKAAGRNGCFYLAVGKNRIRVSPAVTHSFTL